MKISYLDSNRIGDHIWYISHVTKFRTHFPEWTWKYDLETTLVEIYNGLLARV